MPNVKRWQHTLTSEFDCHTTSRTGKCGLGRQAKLDKHLTVRCKTSSGRCVSAVVLSTVGCGCFISLKNLGAAGKITSLCASALVALVSRKIEECRRVVHPSVEPSLQLTCLRDFRGRPCLQRQERHWFQCSTLKD